MLERDRTEREATRKHAGRGNGVEMMAGTPWSQSLEARNPAPTLILATRRGKVGN
jgi:hypothetical protein